MENKDIKTIKTTRGELQYYQDWDCDGMIQMINPQTIDRYHEIRYDKKNEPDSKAYGVFFAFSNEQFDRGYKEAVSNGKMNNGDKVCHYAGTGMYGTRENIKRFLAAYEERDKAIPIECDPQEVYFSEYNNHEAMINWDGDEEAIKLIIDYWGIEVAKKIKRYNAYYKIPELKPEIV